MSDTYSALRCHIVFSTKNREDWLLGDRQKRVWGYLDALARDNAATPIVIGGTENHVHILAGVPPSVAPAQLVQKMKCNSSTWIKENLEGCAGFAWQDGYGIFSVSQSQVEEVKNYILNQTEHHRAKTFKEEYRAFLERHGVKYEEKYLWG